MFTISNEKNDQCDFVSSWFDILGRESKIRFGLPFTHDPAADYHVPTLPGLSESDAKRLRLHSGLVPTSDSGENHLFFALLEAERSTSTEKLVRSLSRFVFNNLVYRLYGLMEV